MSLLMTNIRPGRLGLGSFRGEETACHLDAFVISMRSSFEQNHLSEF